MAKQEKDKTEKSVKSIVIFVIIYLIVKELFSLMILISDSTKVTYIIIAIALPT